MYSVWDKGQMLVVNLLINLRSRALLPQQRLSRPASYPTSILAKLERASQVSPPLEFPNWTSSFDEKFWGV